MTFLRSGQSEFASPKRPVRKRFATALLAVLAAVALGVTASSAQAVPKAPNGFLGIVPQEGITRKDTARMEKGKVKNLRVSIAWDSVQSTSPSTFSWAGFDGIVEAAAREGVRVMPTLYATPTWMSNRSTNLPVKNKSQLDNWRGFVAAAANRYGRNGEFWKEPAQVDSNVPRLAITRWQLWNEPNFHYFATKVNPNEYARLVNAGSAAIRKKDPKAEIVLGGLFGKPKGPPSKARDATTYLKQFAAKVKKNSFDSIAIHPYAANTGKLKQIMKGFRKAAVQSGLKKKKIYVTEIGWGSGKKTNAFLTGSQSAQAKQLDSAFSYLVKERNKLNLKGVYWYAWKDTDPKGENCSFCYTIGLFKWNRTKLKAKPAWKQFVKYTRGRP
ncbi:MAG: glycosyl hydrolase [Acidobacteriota bacterium]